MATGAFLPFPHAEIRHSARLAWAVSGPFGLKRLSAALSSVALHLVAGGMVYLFSVGAGGGMPGDGSGRDLDSGGQFLIAGMVCLQEDTPAIGGVAEKNLFSDATGPARRTEDGTPVWDAPVAVPAVAAPPKEKNLIEKKPEKKGTEEDNTPLAATEAAAVPLFDPASIPAPEADAPEKTLPSKASPAKKARPERPAEQPANNKRIPPAVAGKRPPAQARDARMVAVKRAAGISADAGAGGKESGDNPGGGSAGSGGSPGSGGNKQGLGDSRYGSAASVDSKPKILSRSQVRYPEPARKKKITGYVLLRFHLDEKGSMSQLHVVRADPPGMFEHAALTAVKTWRFSPAVKDGKPVPYWVELPMPFLLK